MLAALAILAAPVRAQQDDVIHTRNGVDLHGLIRAENRDSVVLDLRQGLSTTLPWSRVTSIDYEAPAAFESATDLVTEGRLKDALDALDTLGDTKSLRRPLQQEVLFRRAKLSEQLNQLDAAASGYEALLDTFPDGRYLEDAIRGLVEADLGRGRPEEAGLALDRLEKLPRDGDDGRRLASRLGLLRGLVLEAEQKLPEARTRFEAAEASADLDAAERREASLHVARVLQAQGDLAGAQARYRNLVGSDAPPLVLAGAWNGLASMALEDGVRQRDGDLLTFALLGYLRGVVQYVPAQGESTAELRRAIDGAARCFDYLAQLATDPAVKQFNRRREADMRRRLQDLGT